jgi:LmbE family N-acetylglucosaminyl deacetylase
MWELPTVARLLAICAHPDDESFGLGATLAAFVDTGAVADVLCFTRGEASTVGAALGDLRRIRAEELRAAANALRVRQVTLLDHLDGALVKQPLQVLAEQAARFANDSRADLLLVMDTGGITGHPDHRRATQAALAAGDRLGLAVLGWTIRSEVAEVLRNEFGIPFVGRQSADIDLMLRLDRRRQLDAIACHRSQSQDNPVLWRRLQLQGAEECFHWLRGPEP